MRLMNTMMPTMDPHSHAMATQFMGSRPTTPMRSLSPAPRAPPPASYQLADQFTHGAMHPSTFRSESPFQGQFRSESPFQGQFRSESPFQGQPYPNGVQPNMSVMPNAYANAQQPPVTQPQMPHSSLAAATLQYQPTMAQYQVAGPQQPPFQQQATQQPLATQRFYSPQRAPPPSMAYAPQDQMALGPPVQQPQYGAQPYQMGM